ncbi:MAG: hypothetical protein ACK5H4_14755 [Lacrimispora sphenoides]
MEDIVVNREKRYCQKQAIIFNSFNQIITNTLTGDIMVLFLTDILLFKIVNITFIISLIPLIALVRLPLIFVFRGWSKVKMIEISIIVKVIFVVVLLSVPWNLLGVWNYTALIIIYQISTEYGVGICWQPLMREITTISDRGQFFSRMRFVFMSLNTIFVFLLAFFVGDAMNSIQYKALLYVSLFGLTLQFYAIRKISRKQNIINNNNGNKISRPFLQQISDNKKILWALILDLLFQCIGFTLNVVYLKTVLGYSSKLVSLYITLYNLGGTLLLPLMGRVLDRNLQKGSRYICRLYLIYMVVLIMLPVNLSGSIIYVVFITIFSLLSGVIASGVYLMMTILQHSLVKTEDSFLVLNLYQIIIFAAAFVCTNVFGSIINYARHDRISMTFLFSLDIFKCVYVFLILSSVGIVKMVFHNMYES